MKKKIVMFGSFVVDLMARGPHLPAPGESLKGSMFKMGPGGKGFNQSVAAQKAGADITLVMKLGRDSFAEIALQAMKELQMDTGHLLYSETEPTACALIMVEEKTSQNAIIVVLGACESIRAEEVDSISDLLDESDYMLTQLETNTDAAEYAIELAYQKGVKVILNPAPVQKIREEILKKVDIITPNEVEAEQITGICVDGEENAARAADWFLKRGVGQVVITLGSRGVYLSDGKKSGMIPAFVVPALDTTGAGDAFNGGLAAALAEGADIWEAARFASAVAALSVQRLGTSPSMPDRKEIDAFLEEHR